MKPALLLAAFTLLLVQRSEAQIPVVSKVLPKVTFGVKLGADFQQLNGRSWGNAYNAGITGGAFVALTKKKIGIQMEALVSSMKVDYYFIQGPGYIYILPKYANILYLNVPVLFEYRVVPHLWLQAGPQFSHLLSAKNNQGTDVKNAFNPGDFGYAFGLQAALPAHLTASVRYILGASNIDNGESGVWNTRSVQITVGFRFL